MNLTFRKTLLVLPALVIIATMALIWRNGRTEAPPNLIIICIDTVRYDTFWLPETAGIADRFTPWAKRAVRFENAQSTSSWTVPAVSSVLTGLYPAEHGAGTFKETIASFEVTSMPTSLPGAIDTLPEALAGSKFRSVAWISNPFIEPETGVLQGIADVRVADSPRILELAAEWTSANEKAAPEPYFLYLHLMDAHSDHWKPADQNRAVAAQVPVPLQQSVQTNGPAGICSDRHSEWCVRYLTYVHSVLQIRARLAEFLEDLEKSGALSNTIVILYSDHGEEFTDHAEEGRKHLRDPRKMYGAGHGHTMFQELLHVPLLFWHPGEEGRGVRSLVSLVDITPTIREWLGLPPDERDSGLSLAKPGRLERKRRYVERAVFSSGIAYGAPQRAVFWKQWKRIAFDCPPAVLDFDLSTDTKEKSPKTSSAGSKLAALSDSYSRLRPLAPSGAAPLSPEQIERLKAVGYLQGASNVPTNCPEE
jgi:arylsulfatase A-like enzyme